MSLRDRPLLYVFLETHDLAAQRQFLEAELSLPVIEVDPDPRHRHGVVKYAAGRLIVGLNLSPVTRFDNTAPEGLTIEFVGGADLRTDSHDHRYLTGDAPGPVTALRLAASDVPTCAAFYGDVLGLEPVADSANAFATGSVPIVLEQSERAVRQDTYLLVVHVPDIERARAELAARGVAFAGRGVGSKKIGWTARFADPAGNRWCLYQPSDEVLGWPSGPAVRQILAGQR